MALPDFNGTTVYGLLGIVVYSVVGFAGKLFGADSVRVRLSVFAIIFFGLAVPIFWVAMRGEWFNAPVPGIAVSSTTPVAAGAIPLLWGTAYAQGHEKWIYCGQAGPGGLSGAPFGAQGVTQQTLAGRTVRLIQDTSLYADAPTFAALTLRWTLGAAAGTASRDSALRILAVQALGQDRLWCRVAVG